MFGMTEKVLTVSENLGGRLAILPSCPGSCLLDVGIFILISLNDAMFSHPHGINSPSRRHDATRHQSRIPIVPEAVVLSI